MADPLRLAMWSGPRNISTAMLRSWGNRSDTVVCDEPLYAHYLMETGLDHPGREEVIAHHQPDWRKVVAFLVGPLPDGKTIFYQKHMAHHLLPGIERDWLEGLTHCFLIRDPREMLTSLLEHLPQATLQDTGLPQQVEIMRFVENQTGSVPPILDAHDILIDPRRMLGKLCQAVETDFLESMLEWPAGRRETDGIWAKHWYDAVDRSTGFQPYRKKEEEVPPEFSALLDDCRKCYQELYDQRIRF